MHFKELEDAYNARQAYNFSQNKIQPLLVKWTQTLASEILARIYMDNKFAM